MSTTNENGDLDQLKERTAVVTGGASGIGQEIVHSLAGQGIRVISFDWDGPANEKTAAAIRAEGGDCIAVQGDVSVSSDVDRAFSIAGPVNILVNNAAYCRGDGRLLEVTEEIWDRTLAICLRGVFLCSRAAIASMVKQGGGSIVNISSVNALTGIHLAAYTAAKGGIVSLTRVLAAQYGASNIRVNTICPGTILSDSSRQHYEEHPDVADELKALYPARAFGGPVDIASVVSFLLSGAAAFINGAIIPVDGGLSAVHLLPSLASDPKRS